MDPVIMLSLLAATGCIDADSVAIGFIIGIALIVSYEIFESKRR